MKLYILTDENNTISDVTTNLKEKEKIEEEYIRLWELKQKAEYGNKEKNSNLFCHTYNLGD